MRSLTTIGTELAALALLLCSCGGSDRDAATATQLADGLPALSTLRKSSSPTDHLQNGSGPLLASTGFSIDGTQGELDATDGGKFEWAAYAYSPGADPLIEASITISAANSSGEIYLAWSDYDTGRWESSGPYVASDEPGLYSLPLAPENISGGGTVYVCVLAPLGSKAVVENVNFIAEVNQPPTAVLEASATSGNQSLSVDYSAGQSVDPEGDIASYEWDCDSDGIYEANTGMSPVHSFDYEQPGHWEVRVKVTDGEGLTTVSEPLGITVHGERTRILVEPSSPASQFSLALIDGRPAFTFYYSSGGVAYCESSTPYGTGPSDWSTIQLQAPHGFAGGFTSLANIGGRPALLTNTTTEVGNTGALLYARSPAGDTMLQASWEYTQADVIYGLSYAGSLGEVGGKPAAVYQSSSPASAICYARSSSVDGSDQSDWQRVEVLPEKSITFESPSLCLVGGNPAFLYRGSPGEDLMYVRSTTALGMDALDWQSTDLITEGGISDACLSLVDGHPAIAYKVDSLHDLHYHFSNTELGLDLLDWVDVNLESQGTAGMSCKLTTCSGRPWIAHVPTNPAKIELMGSNNATGSLPGNWDDAFVPNGTDEVSEEVALADINGFPGVVYYDATDDALHYWVLF